MRKTSTVNVNIKSNSTINIVPSEVKLLLRAFEWDGGGGGVKKVKKSFFSGVVGG